MMRSFLGLVFLLSQTVARGQEQNGAEQEQYFEGLDSKQCAELESVVEKVYEKVSPSVVRILSPANPKHEQHSLGSGVIVSSSGEILTCAHFNLLPHTKVIVEMADGSRLDGTVLGSVAKANDGFDRTHDIGMICLDDKREWPAAALGCPSDLNNGEISLALGYPYIVQRGAPPLLRLGRVLPSGRDGVVRSSCRTLMGDSGGPLFDLQGRVLGILIGTPSRRWAATDYTSVEVFVRFWDRLRSGEAIVAEKEHSARPVPVPKYTWGAFEPASDLAKSLRAACPSTVEIVGDGKPVAWGLIVGQDGWIVTKWTELAGWRQLTCRLADGRQLDARVVGGSQEFDLALLKAEATELPVSRWAEAATPHVGQIVASLGADPRVIQFGVVGGSHVANPGVKSYLPILGRPKTPDELSGFIFTEIWREGADDVGNIRTLLKVGDLLTHLDGIATPTLEEYIRVRDKRQAEPDALIGERIKLTVRRGTETFQVFVPIVSEEIMPALRWRECPLSLRRNGFPEVFIHDGGVAPEHCGGPVVTPMGEVVGLNIARVDEIRTFAIPRQVVQKVIAEIRQKAEREKAEAENKGKKAKT